jgi:hypothetical protein
LRRNILLTTIPKSGTHFFLPLISQITGRSLTRPPPIPTATRDPAALDAITTVIERYNYRSFLFFGGHWRFAERHAHIGEAPEWLTLVLIRDPRDIVLSLRDYLEKTKHPKHLVGAARVAGLPRDEQIKSIVGGVEKVARTIGAHCSSYLDWREIGAEVFSYEDLISGAAHERLAKLLEVSPETVTAAVDKSRSMRSVTFNVGRIERWRTEMDAELLSWFHANDDGIVERLGYTW